MLETIVLSKMGYTIFYVLSAIVLYLYFKPTKNDINNKNKKK